MYIIYIYIYVLHMYICTSMYMHIFFCLENTHIYMQTRFRTHRVLNMYKVMS